MSLINSIGGEIPVPKEMPISMIHILAYNRPYPKTVLRRMDIGSNDLGSNTIGSNNIG